MTNRLDSPVALTPGEPAGIGPDLVLQLAHEKRLPPVVVVADPGLLEQRAQLLKLDVDIAEYDPEQPLADHARRLSVLPVSLAAPVRPGVPDTANAGYVLDTLDVAIDACTRRELGALVTGPINKHIINEAGKPFTGHTEYLADALDVDQTVMLLATAGLRVALATTHIPLAEVSAALTPERLSAVLEVLLRGLRERFGVQNPSVVVCGLNPHAGEGGYLGREEIDTIQPVLRSFQQAGADIVGPIPADTAFTSKRLGEADAVLAMYHDQGLPVLKALGFGEAVNVTLGLPIVRTSVDHGTALDLAGTGRADPDSLEAATVLAQALRDRAHMHGRSP